MDGRKFVPKPPHPRATTNILSSLTFSWLIPIFYRGFKTEMETKDLFEPLKDHKSDLLGNRFEKEWEMEIKRAKLKNRQPKLMNVLLRIFFCKNALFGLVLAVLELGIRVVQPFFIGLLVRYFSTENLQLPLPGPSDATYIFRMPEIFEAPKTQISLEEAIFLAGAISLGSLLGVFIVHPYMMGVMHQGMQARVGACSLVYRKALRLSCTALRETTAGQMVNLLSNDVNRFDIAVIFLHYLWIAPLECLIICYFLYRVFQWSTFLGVIFILAQIPLQIYLGKKSSVFRLRTAIRTDERVRLMNEIVNGIQVIKMYAWEMPFSYLVTQARKKEIHEIRGSTNIKAIIVSFYIFSSRFSIFLTAIAFVLSGNTLTADSMFILTAFYNTLKNAMTIFFPMTITQVAEAIISVKRLEKFLLYEENVPRKDLTMLRADIGLNGTISEKLPEQKENSEICFSKASFKWLVDSTDPNLADLTLTVPSGQLLAVIGPVGAGKSTLLQGILKEVPLSSGDMTVKGNLSYASQESWLFAGSIRQNILFGLPYDRHRYKRVIDVCALERDFDLFPNGDRTVVGERGTSLSGGQRARINLARAVYKKADIYLLDDPLSAVDTHVGKHLYEDCINGFLKNKTVILVTHQLQYLTQCKNILLLNNGRVEAFGTFDEIQKSSIDFAKMLHRRAPDVETPPGEDESYRSRKGSLTSTLTTESVFQDQNIPEEKVAKGGLSWRAYYNYYASARSCFMVAVFVILLFLTQIVSSLNDWWASKMSAENELYSNMTKEEFDQITLVNIYYYSALNIGTVLITLARTLVFFAMCRRISQNLHDSMFKKVTCAPMKFFFDNPSGRILNRFSKDMGSIDELLPMTMIDCYQIFIFLFAIVLICAMISPILIAPTFAIAVIFYLLRIVYVRTSRNIKRLEGTTRSPVFSHLNASLQGLTTIRAFGAQDILQKEFDSYQDMHSGSWYIFIASSRAFGFWLDSICVVYIAIVCFTLLYLGKTGAEAGLAITQSIGLTGMFQWGMRQSAEMENQMTSVERVVEYTNMEQEPPLESTSENKPPPSWPPKGAIAFQNVVLRYDPLGDPSLYNLSFSIQPQEKIGIVGRTGAGKSTLISAMFRLAYIEGKIVIDSVDTSTVGLHDLRSKISIIPQEPVLFSGTLRRNLDPFDEYPDWCLWNALEEVELKDIVSESPEGLHGRMSEGGSNFSVGQRQLICLARAIVRNNRILIMDEATANVDPQTDQLIQRTIRRKFNDCTVLTIAHRLNTVMDSDRILVMDAGQLVEFAHPYILLKDPLSQLAQLVQQTGPGMARKLKTIAKRNYKMKLRREEARRLLQLAQEHADDTDSSSSSSPDISTSDIRL